MPDPEPVLLVHNQQAEVLEVHVLAQQTVGPDDDVDLALGQVQARLAKVDYFAGTEFTTADIMIVFSLTTMRLFLPFGLAPYPAILGYLKRIGAREAYRRAMHKGDPDMAPLLN